MTFIDSNYNLLLILKSSVFRILDHTMLLNTKNLQYYIRKTLSE